MQCVFGRFFSNDPRLDILLLKQNHFFRKLRYLGNRFIKRKEIANSLRRWFYFRFNNSGCYKDESPRIDFSKQFLSWLSKFCIEYASENRCVGIYSHWFLGIPTKLGRFLNFLIEPDPFSILRIFVNPQL